MTDSTKKPRELYELVDPTRFHGIRYWDCEPNAKSTDGFEKLLITKFVEHSALLEANREYAELQDDYQELLAKMLNASAEIERLEAIIAALTVKVLT